MRHRRLTEDPPRPPQTGRVYRGRPVVDPGTTYRARAVGPIGRDRLAFAGVVALLVVEVAVSGWIVAGGAAVIAHVFGQP